MGRSKKQALSQKVVNAATTGMPSPLRKILGGRVVALLIVLALPILYATGIVTVDWENGRPRLSINRERASEVRQQAAEKMDELQDDQAGHFTRLVPASADDKTLFSSGQQPGERLTENVTNRLEQLTGGEADESGNTRQATRPLSRLREQFDRR